VPSVPGCLEDALEALRKDHEFLLKGDVFTEDLIETWIDYKYDRDVNPCVCGRILGSSLCTTTADPQGAGAQKTPASFSGAGFFVRRNVPLRPPTCRQRETLEE